MIVASLIACTWAYQPGVWFGAAPSAKLVRSVPRAMDSTDAMIDIFADALVPEDDTLFISLFGHRPVNAHPDATTSLGRFKRLDQMVNGKPSYTHASRRNVRLWGMPNGDWCLGLNKELGTGRCLAYSSNHRSVMRPQDIEGKWKVLDNAAGWVENVDLRVTLRRPQAESPPLAAAELPVASLSSPAPLSSDSTPVNPPPTPSPPVVSPPERAVLRTLRRAKANTNVWDTRPRPQPKPDKAAAIIAAAPRKQAPESIETRVMMARSTCRAASDAAYRALIQQALDCYMADEIDEEELKRQKQAARREVNAGPGGILAALEATYEEYEAAVARRTAAEAMEGEAAARLEAALLRVTEDREVAPPYSAPPPRPAASIDAGSDSPRDMSRSHDVSSTPLVAVPEAATTPAATNAPVDGEQQGEPSQPGPVPPWVDLRADD